MPVALAGLVLAAAGTAELFPTLLSLVSLAVAVLGLAFSALTLPLLALSRYPVTPRPAAHYGAEARVPSAHSS